MKIEPFLLFLVDEDKREFTILGPITDDSPWIDRAWDARKAGRKVNTFTASTAQDKDAQGVAYAKQSGHRYVSRNPF